MQAMIQNVPAHLKPFIATQDPSLYTAIDHASWRFIMRISQAYFDKTAHEKYLTGLKETGISTDRIPLITEMDTCLKKFGWRAVPISGFIPPAAFMEFQSLGILPIACEMRTLEHLAYTPAPDIVHEAAGHAPILVDPEFATFLKRYGEVARRAIFSKEDLELYEAIRILSEVKEDPTSTCEEIERCQNYFEQTAKAISYISEASYLARMGWWTFEYGLVGDLKNPKIYGAGLLSSVGESYHCLSGDVKKLHFNLACLNTSYDITRPQPQLFVTPDFPTLSRVLEEYAATMAYQVGGTEGVEKAKRARVEATVELDSGVQIGGVVTHFITDALGQPAFIKLNGPTQVGYQETELPDQGPDYHRDGFSSPIGRLVGVGKSPADLTDADFTQLGFEPGKKGKFEFESGFILTGILESRVVRDGRNLVLVFSSCTVTREEQVYFEPSWGSYDLACGGKVISVFGGAPDRGTYLRKTGGFKQKPRPPKTNLTHENKELTELYAQVRSLRDAGQWNDPAIKTLETVVERLDEKYVGDWLLRYEILELIEGKKLPLKQGQKLRAALQTIAQSSKEKSTLISRGLAAL